MTFKIGSADYSGNIVIGTYNINSIEEAEEYKDGYGRTHKMHIIDKIKGSFDMFFKTLTEYNTFISALNTAKNNISNTYDLTLSVNNLNQELTRNCFVSFQTNRTTNGSRTDFFEQFTVTIEET